MPVGHLKYTGDGYSHRTLSPGRFATIREPLRSLFTRFKDQGVYDGHRPAFKLLEWIMDIEELFRIDHDLVEDYEESD